MKVSIVGDKNWIVMRLSHRGDEVEIDASEIACRPIGDLITALENCCIYNESSSLVWDAEGTEYKIEFGLNGNFIELIITHVRGNKNSVLFKAICDNSQLIIGFWRGLKALLANSKELNDLSVIENYVKTTKS